MDPKEKKTRLEIEETPNLNPPSRRCNAMQCDAMHVSVLYQRPARQCTCESNGSTNGNDAGTCMYREYPKTKNKKQKQKQKQKSGQETMREYSSETDASAPENKERTRYGGYNDDTQDPWS